MQSAEVIVLRTKCMDFEVRNHFIAFTSFFSKSPENCAQILISQKSVPGFLFLISVLKLTY